MKLETATLQIGLETGRWELLIKGRNLAELEPVVGRFLVDKITLEQIEKIANEGLQDEPELALRKIKALIAPQRMIQEAMGL